jgi:hypothetical protein
MNSRRFRIISIVCLFSLLLAGAFAGCATKPQATPPVQPQAEVPVVQPVISELKAASQVALLGSTQVVCAATETGVDNLTYNWGTTGGTITGAGSTVTWTSPEKGGDFMITVVVSDGNGGAAKKSVIINVPDKPNNPPVITAIKFTRPSHLPVTIRPNMTDDEKKKLPELVARKYVDTCDISCQASDPDGDKIDYIWQATGGKIIGSGPNIQWIAAGDPGIYTISVEVTDDKGASTSFQITVNVHCCSG